MSYILEALKKAERDRHAGQAPAVDEALRPNAAPRRRNPQSEQTIRVVAIAVACVAIAGFGALLLRRPAAAPQTVAVQPVQQPAATMPAAPMYEEPAPALRVDPERLLALESGMVNEELGEPAASLDELVDDSSSRIPSPAPAAAATAAPVPVIAAPAANEFAEPPEPPPVRLLKDMPSSYRAEFPKLSIDVHSYDDNPLRRFVLVNGRKYRETDTLVEGPRIEEIVPEGVVFEHRGSKVLQEIPH